jgi:glucose-6-phosphate isomerase
MTKLTERIEWQALQTHQKVIATYQMQDLFKQDPQRFTRFSFSVEELLFDYSKNRITAETLSLLSDLAKAVKLKQKITALFAGERLNSTENRAALHTALRAPLTDVLYVNGHNIMRDVHATLAKMRIFTEQVRSKAWRGYTGKPICDIVNIGIGGSHLGPLMAVSALEEFAALELRCHFVSNIDTAHISAILRKIKPETTLFIISSKSFTTLETMTNAQTLRSWVQDQLGTRDVAAHFVAITAETEQAIQFGIPRENIFTLWDWVGGRYSIWSAIGLPLALMIGMDNFLEFLAGAYAMDQHFCHAEFDKNMPVIMGLLGIWYINFFGTAHHAIVPYSHYLNYFRMHIQQVDMESNGKSLSQPGAEVNFLTAPIIFGEQGCNGQHAFHQLFHQGPHLIPVDFILVGHGKYDMASHHNILVGSGLSQAQALMCGRSYEEAWAELSLENNAIAERELLAKHKVITGNRPSNILFLNKISPRNLGTLLALYEHKTFVQGILWGINSFDQWGVELGKKLLPAILAELSAAGPLENKNHDSSTQGLIQYYKNLKRNP